MCRYARKHFTAAGSENLVKDIQSAMGLLAFSPSTRCKRYQVRALSVHRGRMNYYDSVRRAYRVVAITVVN